MFDAINRGLVRVSALTARVSTLAVCAMLFALAACRSTETEVAPEAEIPADAAFARFLAENGPVREIGEIAVLTWEEPSNFAHVAWSASFPAEAGQLNLVGIGLPDADLAYLHLLAPDWTTERGTAASPNECRLENYHDQPGVWDFAHYTARTRNTANAQRWRTFGDCVERLVRGIEGEAGADCFISTTPIWNEEERYDLKSWTVCSPGRLV